MSCLNTIFPTTDPPNVEFSGGGRSEHANCSYGVSSIRGKRNSMEDFYEAQFIVVEDTIVMMELVLQTMSKETLFKNLTNHPDFITDTKRAIVETYQQTDMEYLKEERGKQKDAGSTASTAVLLGHRLLVANVGDSRVVISRAGKAIPLSTDHKPNRKGERQRIEKAGGAVIWAGTWRVSGILAVSRAFGDRLLKRFVVADPELQEEMINDEHEFLILASDGLWDVCTNQDAISLVSSILNAEDAAKRLTEEALRKGSADNITCVVVRFHESTI